MSVFENPEALIKLAQAAGAAIMAVRESGTMASLEKSDNSPVTQADIAANDIITAGLRQLDNHSDIIAEESYNGEKFDGTAWLVDPLDGTKEFINHSKDFTVNIAYLQNYRPIFGIVYAPAHDKLYCGYENKAFLWHEGKRQNIGTRTKINESLTVYGSLRHDDKTAITKLLRDLQLGDIVDFIPLGSSLKFCLLAEGKADAYVRLSPTHIWDTAAGDAVLRAANGAMFTPQAGEFTYGAEILNGGFLALSEALAKKISAKC